MSLRFYHLLFHFHVPFVTLLLSFPFLCCPFQWCCYKSSSMCVCVALWTIKERRLTYHWKRIIAWRCIALRYVNSSLHNTYITLHCRVLVVLVKVLKFTLFSYLCLCPFIAVHVSPSALMHVH